LVSPTAHITYFGLWSAKKLKRALELLSALEVRFEVDEEMADQERLEAWGAWDASDERPNIGFNLWIWAADLPKLGTGLVDEFPERKFGA
jgi:hypothetical protein